VNTSLEQDICISLFSCIYCGTLEETDTFNYLGQRFSNCGPRTTSGPRVLPLWPFQIEH